jgi:hypothetical protein
MQNPDDFKEYQILGANVQVIMDGFGTFTLLASKMLLEAGLGVADPDTGLAVLQPDKWYPLDSFLRAFDRIGAEFGELTVRTSGLHINKKASVPGDVLSDIHQTFTILDQGYHFNHAKNGVPMFNPQTGQMTEGIGHFTTRPGPNKRELMCEIDTPYPCAFDEGIVRGFAQRFDPMSRVTHDPKICRKKGHKACLIHISWK